MARGGEHGGEQVTVPSWPVVGRNLLGLIEPNATNGLVGVT